MKPTDSAFSTAGTEFNVVDWGMSIRTYLAGQALTGYLAAYSGDGIALPQPKHVAAACAAYADALIAELNK